MRGGGRRPYLIGARRGEYVVVDVVVDPDYRISDRVDQIYATVSGTLRLPPSARHGDAIFVAALAPNVILTSAHHDLLLPDYLAALRTGDRSLVLRENDSIEVRFTPTRAWLVR